MRTSYRIAVAVGLIAAGAGAIGFVARAAKAEADLHPSADTAEIAAAPPGRPALTPESEAFVRWMLEQKLPPKDRHLLSTLPARQQTVDDRASESKSPEWGGETG
jgi:hypothetical protein